MQFFLLFRLRSLIRTGLTVVGGAAFLGFATEVAADFVNGGFETGDFTGWTISTYDNPPSGVTLASPPEETLRPALNLGAGGVAASYVRTDPVPESQYDPQLGPSSSLRFPLFGNDTAVINYYLTSSRNVNGLTQTMTVTSADVDPDDNKPHVRFAVAPVLADPGHPAEQQPYYFVNVRNVTTGETLFHSFKYANQPGVPWKVGPGGYLYTDWQLVDVAPGAGKLSVGDQVEVEIIAARCAQSGHSGYVYVDGISSFLPGVSVVATGPEAANAGTNITYRYKYRNGATKAVSNATVRVKLPANTTFVSVDASGANCTTPSVGGTGTVSCNVGTLNENESGSFLITVRIDDGASGTIGHGDYDISSDDTSALLGPLVQTSVTSGVDYADLEASITNGIPAVGWGNPVQYTLSVVNNGPNPVTGATVEYTAPAELTGVTWTCTASGGATCNASGTGNINESVSLPNGAAVVFTIDATVVAGAGSGTIVNTATVTAPGTVTDNVSSNNTAVDTDQVGTLRALTVSKNTAAGGTVLSAPVAINCGTSCSNSSASFVDGSSVTLTAVAATNYLFHGWSGGGCSGTGTCTVTMSADTTVNANFDCLGQYYGVGCQSLCPGGGNCSGNGTCSAGASGTGVCTCAAGFMGADCSLPDGDGDNTTDASDCAPADPTRWQNQAYPDADGDGVRDSTTLMTVSCFGTTPPAGYTLATNGPDNCPSVPNPSQIDTDSDGYGNECDDDDDGDGILDVEEGNGDSDGDGIPNSLDLDSDNDGIPDSVEGKGDADNDGIPNFLDRDSDNDGVLDIDEKAGDADGDGIPNFLDSDSDGDGVPDYLEAQPSEGFIVPVKKDTDSDGIDDAFDPDNGGVAITIVDSDGDGIPDYLDTDSDNDGVNDGDEAYDLDNDGKRDVLPLGIDANRNGIDDAYESFLSVTPENLPNHWRDPSNGVAACQVVDLKPNVTRVKRRAKVLRQRAHKFSARAAACGARADYWRDANRKFKRLKTKLDREIGTSTLSCGVNVCSQTSTDGTVRALRRLSKALYRNALNAKLATIAKCGAAPKEGEDRRNNTADDFAQVKKALRQLPATLTSCP